MNPANSTETPQERLEQLFVDQLPTALRGRSTTAKERLGRLTEFRDALLTRRAQFYEAFQEDFRKPAAEVELSEFLPVLEEVRQARKHLRGWMRPQRTPLSLTAPGTRSHILAQPRGRCLILGPWNYPLNTLLCPLVSAISAGNTVILKPSELAPAVAAVISELVHSVFDPCEVATVNGGADTAKRLLALPFDHVFFTGSTTVGRQVMAAAAKHLTSVTLELGGKSPTIIDRSADITAAAESLMWGKLVNFGQSCVAPDYVFVHNSVREGFVKECRRVVAQRYGDPAQQRETTDLARIINVRHAERIASLIDDALAKGAIAKIGGGHDAAARFIEPTLLECPLEPMRVLEEEIFGPVLPVVGYDTLDDVIAYINARPKPLALYVWSRDEAITQLVLQQTSSGGACINQCMLQYVNSHLPFGGVNESGIGNSHGYYGFRAFSHERAVLRGGRYNFVKMMMPPYTASRQRLVQRMVDALRII